MPFLSIDNFVIEHQNYDLYKKITTIGSSPDCDIPCAALGVEPLHAMITLEKDGYEIEPASRKAEIYIDEKRIKKKTLIPHDADIALGQIHAKFSLFDKPQSKSAQSDAQEYTHTAFEKLQRMAEDLSQGYDVDAILTHAIDDVISLVHADKGFFKHILPRLVKALARDFFHVLNRSALGNSVSFALIHFLNQAVFGVNPLFAYLSLDMLYRLALFAA